ncbi:hypothetical protein [Streptomyces sp. SBT349]|uniref:hypothetical protein n=1 Tax=Streptomyces sp. SBT349 TaxID=1580539 RepID=UPI00066A1EFA|nr:hypothetical protein [Streptomyces sp. SBT349]
MQYIERFRLNSRGAKALLRSDGVREDMQRRADAIKAVAEPQWQAATAGIGGLDPVRVIADTSVGSGRAFGTVIAIHPASLRIEQDRRILGGAIDAARN